MKAKDLAFKVINSQLLNVKYLYNHQIREAIVSYCVGHDLARLADKVLIDDTVKEIEQALPWIGLKVIG